MHIPVAVYEFILGKANTDLRHSVKVTRNAISLEIITLRIDEISLTVNDDAILFRGSKLLISSNCREV